MSSLPYRELKSALTYYSGRTGWRWNVRITQIQAAGPGGQGGHAVSPAAPAGRHGQTETSKPTPSVRLDLTPSDALALATVLNAAADPGQGRKPVNRTVPIMPEIDDEDEWLTTTAVAKRLGVASTTITSWLTRSGPKTCPFPQGIQVNYRNYWQASVIDQWGHTWRNPLQEPEEPSAGSAG